MTVTGAEALLLSLKANGIDYLFANAGSDFAPVIEAYAAYENTAALPAPVICPHENVAVGMAHGFYLAAGRPQSVMVHVNVGLANAVMGLINARADDVPVIMLSGRTPFTEHDRLGGKMTTIQYGQEMADQAALVRETVKWDYELRYAEQAAAVADRAVAIAMSAPTGPVYLSLPREPLCEATEKPDLRPRQSAAVAPVADPAAIAEAARLLAAAKSPLIIAQKGDLAGRAGPALERMSRDHAIAVIEMEAPRNVVTSDHPMLVLGDAGTLAADADVILVVDATVPWIERRFQARADQTVIHLGADPLHAKLPMRSFQTDIAIAGEVGAAIESLATALADLAPDPGGRFAAIKARHDADVAAMTATAANGAGSPMSVPHIGACLSDIIDDRTLIISERGPKTPHVKLKAPNQLFSSPFSGGLGWGLPTALGAQLADRDRLVIAVVGDGSYMFANPVACHQIAETYDLPVLTIVLNNGVWNAVRTSTTALYPDGAAAKANLMPLTDLSTAPDYTMVAAASRAYTEKVGTGADLPAALARAVEVIRDERRQVLLELKTDWANPKAG